MLSDTQRKKIKYELLELLLTHKATAQQIYDFCSKTGSLKIEAYKWITDELDEDADWQTTHIRKQKTVDTTTAITEVLTYEDDQLINRQLYDMNSDLLCLDQQMVNGVKHGLTISYGAEMTLTTYLNGKEHGRQITLDQHGKLTRVTNYRHGIKISCCSFQETVSELDPELVLVHKHTTYVNGRVSRIKTYKPGENGLQSLEEFDCDGNRTVTNY